MKNIQSAFYGFLNLRSRKFLSMVACMCICHLQTSAQTFEFPSVTFVDSLSLRDIVTTSGPDTLTVTQGEYNSMWNATTASGFTIKSILALTNFKVDVQSPNVGEKHSFTYLITYKTIGTPNPASTNTVTSNVDTLSVSYNRDSLRFINDRAFSVAGKFHRLKIVIYDVFEITNSGSGPVYTQLLPNMVSTVPTFVNVFGEIYVQKYYTPSSLNMPTVTATNNINVDGTVSLNWSSSSTNYKPAGYEVEWTYTDPGISQYDFRNNATRIFTNNAYFNIPVAQKQGTLYYHVRMVRPDLNNLLSRTYGAWNSVSSVTIQSSAHDSLNWDLKMSFVEDGKYKQVITYYDGLLKPKQVQTRFNSRPTQTVVAQSLYDHEGRAVVNSLPIPVNGVNKFSYISNFLRPSGASEYAKLMYDALPDTAICPGNEVPMPTLDPGAPSNEYYSANNPSQTGKNAFIPDAEGYPLVRKIIAAENHEKVLFEGQAGYALQLGNDRHTAYLYGSPIQSELNKYFGQDIGGSNYYRKMITTDNHEQDMFTITNGDGKPVITGLIGTPDTNNLALSVRNSPVNDSFKSNLMPIPNLRLSDEWQNNGSYFVERDANYSFEYSIAYNPFKPCGSVTWGLRPKIYYDYEVLDNCGNIRLQHGGILGDVGITTSPTLSHAQSASAFLKKGNHVWNKYSYIKPEDLAASVDSFLNLPNGCFLTFNDFLREEFIKAKFPCKSNYDPCTNMKIAMMKELYPGAKYGQYLYVDSISKTFAGPKPNSIFEIDTSEKYRYQKYCIVFPDTVYSLGKKYYHIDSLQPQELIEMFNDTIAEALLPLHPDYCKLQFCEILNDPYATRLGQITKASNAVAISRYDIADIANNDPLYINNFLTTDELSKTIGSELSVDSIAFKRTICGSEFGRIEKVCNDINAAKMPSDIVNYPSYMQDEYYQNLIRIYIANRDERISEKLRQLPDTCGPCALARLKDLSRDTSIAVDDDSTFLVKGLDSTMKNLKVPGLSSASALFSSNLTMDSLSSMMNVDNSVYCSDRVNYIVDQLVNCNVSQTVLDELRDTLLSRFCVNYNKITSLSYDSLTAIMTEVGISSTDLCNAGLADLRLVARKAGSFVQLGLLHYSPAYYTDLLDFLHNNSILDFIAGANGSMNVSLALCNAHPFEQYLAQQLGGTPSPLNCNNTLSVTLTKVNDGDLNTVTLSFDNGGTIVNYFLYPADTGVNALSTDFGITAISSPYDYKVKSLFNLYGFDRISQSFANRNTTLLLFTGTKDGLQKDFAYFLSAFNEQSDYNMMEKDQKEYLNGIGCSEFVPMAKNVLTEAAQLGIKPGHPYFEKYFANVLNYQNKINFDINNYESALQSCGVTDSVIIPKYFAHFKIKFPLNTTINTIENYLDVLRDTNHGVSISGIQSYELNGYKYLLLDIYESDTTLKASKQMIQSSPLPSGSTIQYLPYLQQDTVAQLLSSNFNPVDLNALAAAFPGATITYDSVTLYYFISGYGVLSTPGNYVTVVKSISTPFDYNHYVDSICRFVNLNAPMTAILTHAESAVSAQYNDWQMAAWRNYVNSLTRTNHNELVKKSKAPKFNVVSASNGTYSFASSKFSYFNARRPHYHNDLYIDHEPTGNTKYNYLKQLLLDLESANGTSLFVPHLTQSPVNDLVVNQTETRAYVCGDTTVFWVNHFDTSREMTNIFVKLPPYLPVPRQSYQILSISKGFEKDSITYLNVSFVGQHSGVVDTIHCVAYCGVNLGGTYTIPSAFLSSHSQYAMLSDRFESCETRTIETLYPAATVRYHQYIDSVREILIAQFRQHILDSLQEQLSIMGNDIKHGLTLYYYDMAGNLIKTVSPAGVQKLSVLGANNDTINAHRRRNEKINPLVPAHSKVTWYKYNAQNKVVSTGSPDAGTTISKYDLMGRVVVSQDAKQALGNNYTYFLYDNLSRVIETGVINKNTAWPDTFFTGPGSSVTSLIKGSLRTEVTATLYDTASYKTVTPFNNLPAQENLKNRVSCTKYFEILKPNVNASSDSGYSNALHYSYDISGNVKTLIHDLKTVVDSQLRFKRVDYEYDLYSGKVTLVGYNRGKADQFYQKYTYDSDNRIVDVHTSNNGLKWDRDAHYDYYDHGPLARTQLGEQRVQGVDYAYTINGWLKAINGVQNHSQGDMGEDGIAGGVMPKDVFSQRIDYFTNDYKAIGDTGLFKELPTTPKSLYNGNIAAIATALTPFNNVYSKYHYDPLQRIDRADYTDYDYNYTSSLLTTANIPDWHSEYKYDGDGNLLKLKREGGTVPAPLNGGTAIAQHNMDQLTYRYTAGTNQLSNLTDSSTSTAYKIDIPNLTDTSITRYTYDATGNMTKDLVSGLTNIEWNRFGKVKSITKIDGSILHFTYDPMGNRLAKEHVTYPGTDTMVKLKTVYVRDAAGNSLAVYEDMKEFDLTKLTLTAVTSSPGVFHGPVDPAFSHILATQLYSAYQANPSNNLAQLAMTIPQLDYYTGNATLLQDLVGSLTGSQSLALLKSIPAITLYTLKGTDENFAPESDKLSLYMQPILLSTNLDPFQIQFFSELKERNIDLYNATVETVPASEQEKEDFPSDLAMLTAFKGMDPGAKLEITNALSQALTSEHRATLPAMTTVIAGAYTTNNTFSNFVLDVSNRDDIFDQLRADALDYIGYRYGLVEQEELELDTVKHQFKYNTVLTAIVADQDVAVTTNSLTLVLSDYFDNVVTLAQTHNKGPQLLTAMKTALSAIDVDLVPVAWLKMQEILQSSKAHLAEHHIYGSSRLGMQKYLPAELRFEYKPNQSPTTFHSLIQPKPWYSHYGNDLFSSSVFTNNLNTNNLGTNGMGINTHILGNRHYELTNHLGNVQATVIDRTSPVIDTNQNDTLLGYLADISTAQDYYPFGMLMPGRYTSDTIKHCVTINSVVLVSKPLDVKATKPQAVALAYKYGASPAPPSVGQLPKAASFADEVLHVFHYNPLNEHPNGWVVQTTAAEDHIEYDIDLSDEPGELDAYLQLHMDTNQTEQLFGFGMELHEDVIVEMRVRQYANAQQDEYYDVVDWTTIGTGGAQEVLVPVNKNAINAGGNTILQFKITSVGSGTFASGLTVKATTPWTLKTQLVPENRVVTICDEKDNYRFGFNGMEKDNEPKGIGNSLDFGARIYDSRLGRWLSLDPLSINFPAWSPYNFTLNNPILLKDPDGREPTKAQAGTAAGFITTINTTGTKLGLKKGASAHEAMIGLGKTGGMLEHGRPMPINTQRINTFKDKYIYTEKGGWIDMSHFMFYAGKAYDYKMQKEQAQKIVNTEGFMQQRHGQESILRKAAMDPVGEAVQDGYMQEMTDRAFAKHSAYSYEDLPSDKLGADFGANHFDPNSNLSFGEQLGNYLDGLGATSPENAPNYDNLPESDKDIGNTPSETNKTTKPMHTKP